MTTETAQMELLKEGRRVGTATAEIQISPGECIVGWELTNVELAAEYDLRLGEDVACCFTDPLQAIAFVGGKEPERIKKDQ